MVRPFDRDIEMDLFLGEYKDSDNPNEEWTEEEIRAEFKVDIVTITKKLNASLQNALKHIKSGKQNQTSADADDYYASKKVYINLMNNIQKGNLKKLFA